MRVVGVESGFARIGVKGNLSPVRRGGQRARDGVELRAGVTVGILNVGQQRQRGPLAGRPGQRWGEGDRFLEHRIDLCVRVTVNTEQTNIELVRQGEVDVGRELIALEVAELGDEFAAHTRPRKFTDHVDDPAGRTLAIQHGRRPFQNLDLLQRVDVRARVVVRAEQRLQAVAIFRDLQAAHGDPVAAGGEAVALSRYARAVHIGIGQVQRAFVEQIALGFDGDRARQRHDGGVGLERAEGRQSGRHEHLFDLGVRCRLRQRCGAGHCGQHRAQRNARPDPRPECAALDRVSHVALRRPCAG